MNRGSKGGHPPETAAALRQARDLHKRGLYKEAEDICRKLLLQNPDNTAAMISLGLALQQRGLTEEAQALYRNAARREPHNCFALVPLAHILMDLGNREEALVFAEKARRSKPPAPLLNSLGVLYRDAGLREKAVECLEAALSADPGYATPYFNLMGLKKFSAGDTAFTGLMKIAQNPDALPYQQRIHLEFALGRAYLDTGDADSAFRHYAEANRLKKNRLDYNIADTERYIDGAIHLFSEAHVKKLLGRGGAASEQPVFIVGMPRSGSTLVDQIIASHPEAASVGEARFLEKSIPVYPNVMMPGYGMSGAPMISQQMMDSLTPETLDIIAEKYLAQTAPFSKGAKRIVDKTLFNYQWIGIIRLALPNAKIIHCTRDPRDMGLSIWQTSFSENLVKWANDLEDIGRYYHSYRKMMAHWEKLFPGQIYEVNYETLVASQEPETRRLIEFCGLPWNERCLKFHETERVVKTASTGQVRRPLYGDSVQKWKQYEKYLTPLLETLEKP